MAPPSAWGFLTPSRAFISDDLPTLDRPMIATSGASGLSLATCSHETPLPRYVNPPENNFLESAIVFEPGLMGSPNPGRVQTHRCSSTGRSGASGS
eukprot:CAMPEP_0171514830 /NCGR_PEP_ID=MMETSP0959-20130129/3082_1 /TAXON_ID=87120 /ORGANISM="Aurantiochytrium limacinum, Strain ATCCMYA-1381" /LENGTH=95 /DNA_ID=CAMNT_0012053239 /DNA_START=145 /DNA_END=435 /DNA_ORIENTATION=+